jgi:zinc protease
LKEPELAARSMDQKRDEIVRGLKRESQSPDALVRKITSAIFYAGTPYENRPEGTEETVANLDEAMCRKAIAQATIPSRMLVVVVSADSQDAVKQALEGLFGWAKAPETEPARTPLAVPAPKERSAFAKRPTATTYIRGQFSTPSPDDPGYPVAKVLMTILHDRLWDAIRTKRALSYAPGAGIGAQRENLGVITASSTDPKKTIEVMLEEMAKLKADLVTASELKAVVAGDVTHRAEQSESSSAHAAALGRAELLQGGWKKLYEETDDLGKVTAEQVRDAARKLLTDVRWGFVGKEPVDKDVYEKSGERPREDDVK